MKKIKGSFLFKIKGSDGKVQEWLVDLKSAPGSVTKGSGMQPVLVHIKYLFQYTSLQV